MRYNLPLFIHRNYKFIIVGLSLLLLGSVFLFGAGAKDGKVHADTYNEKYFKCISVDADDTLWSIAEANISEEYASIEDYIAEVKSINNLTGDKIYCGASLVVPYYASPR